MALSRKGALDWCSLRSNSLKRFTYVYPACGSTHNAIKISIPKLEEVTSYPTWIDVTKPKEN